MTLPNQRTTLLSVYDRFCQQLPSGCNYQMAIAAGDPSELPKHGRSITRMRLLPEARVPARFWNSDWCFFQVSLGEHQGENIEAEVFFFQAPSRKDCGGGTYTRGTADILRSLKGGLANQFSLHASDGTRGSFTIYKREYKRGTFTVESAAKDLNWLVGKTVPAFAALGA